MKNLGLLRSSLEKAGDN